LQRSRSGTRRGAIADRISAIKARRKDQDVVAELEEIVDNLLSDKNELVRIARAFEEDLVAQRISEADINDLTNDFVPILKGMLEESAGSQVADPAALQRTLDAVTALLSVETVTILQTLGFNFKRAIGEPRTSLVASRIASATPQTAQQVDLQTAIVHRDIAIAELMKDAESAARWMQLLSRNAEHQGQG
jgi:hypothetical protein